MKYKKLCWLGIFFISGLVSAQIVTKEIPLWNTTLQGKDFNEKVRIYEETGDHVVSNVHNPSIKGFLPEKNISTGVAVIIAPGGGHRELWIDHEGYNVAKWLSEKGIAAFVLKYRLANEDNSTYTVDDHSVGDMLRAIQIVRYRAGEWSIDPGKVGVMGFSAGGEIAALTDMRDTFESVHDDVSKQDFHPGFHALIYPGRSNRINPSKKSSPVFILAGYHDRDDISKGMAELYLKYKNLNIPAELHIYAQAGHGFGLREMDSGAHTGWLNRLCKWLKDMKLIRNE